MRHTLFSLLLLLTLCFNSSLLVNAAVLRVGTNEKYKQIKPALAEINKGDTLIISKGIYKEGNLIVDKSITILGQDNPVLDGEFEHEVISIKTNHVTVKGLTIQNSGRGVMSDPGGIKIYDSNYVTIEGNTLLNNYFGVYLQYVKHCVVKNNVIIASQTEENKSGNGVHAWKSDSIQVIGNLVKGHRDGIYFEFVKGAIVWRNRAHDNLRYGLHFMTAPNNAYISNVFRHNGAGVAVMFTRNVVMINNTFEENRGDATYGVLFKELSDCYLSGNKFIRNTTGIFLDGTSRMLMEKNLFKENGWAMRLQANCIDNRIEQNSFLGNTFDVTTNGTLTMNTFHENYWDKYEGYDLNKDKIGDVPYHPLSLYAVIIEKNPPAMLLFRSFMIGLLDKSEKIMPSLTPENFVDNRPRMTAPSI